MALKIYIDNNYPNPVVEILERVHALQKEMRYEIIRWKGEVDEGEYRDSVFLLRDRASKGLEIPTVKHYEDGMRVVAMKTQKGTPIDRFEFAMTLLRMWPSLIEKAETEKGPFLATMKYGGKRLDTKLPTKRK